MGSSGILSRETMSPWSQHMMSSGLPIKKNTKILELKRRKSRFIWQQHCSGNNRGPATRIQTLWWATGVFKAMETRESLRREKPDSACTWEGSRIRHTTTSFTPIQCILKQARVTVAHARLISAQGWAGRWQRSAFRGLLCTKLLWLLAQWSVWLVVWCDSYCQATTNKNLLALFI